MKQRNRQSPQWQRGQGTIEYSLVVFLVVVVLIAQPSVVDDLVTALRDAYESFVYAISWSDIPIS